MSWLDDLQDLINPPLTKLPPPARRPFEIPPESEFNIPQIGGEWGRDQPARMPGVDEPRLNMHRVPFGTPQYPLLELDSGLTKIPFGPPGALDDEEPAPATPGFNPTSHHPYDSVGAMGGLFAPAWLYGDEVSRAAVEAWNAKNLKKPPAPFSGNISNMIGGQTAPGSRDSIAAALLGSPLGGSGDGPGGLGGPGGASDSPGVASGPPGAVGDVGTPGPGVSTGAPSSTAPGEAPGVSQGPASPTGAVEGPMGLADATGPQGPATAVSNANAPTSMSPEGISAAMSSFGPAMSNPSVSVTNGVAPNANDSNSVSMTGPVGMNNTGDLGEVNAIDTSPTAIAQAIADMTSTLGVVDAALAQTQTTAEDTAAPTQTGPQSMTTADMAAALSGPNATTMTTGVTMSEADQADATTAANMATFGYDEATNQAVNTQVGPENAVEAAMNEAAAMAMANNSTVGTVQGFTTPGVTTARPRRRSASRMSPAS
jgi:hypothetical protein